MPASTTEEHQRVSVARARNRSVKRLTLAGIRVPAYARRGELGVGLGVRVIGGDVLRGGGVAGLRHGDCIAAWTASIVAVSWSRGLNCTNSLPACALGTCPGVM